MPKHTLNSSSTQQETQAFYSMGPDEAQNLDSSKKTVSTDVALALQIAADPEKAAKFGFNERTLFTMMQTVLGTCCYPGIFTRVATIGTDYERLGLIAKAAGLIPTSIASLLLTYYNLTTKGGTKPRDTFGAWLNGGASVINVLATIGTGAEAIWYDHKPQEDLIVPQSLEGVGPPGFVAISAIFFALFYKAYFQIKDSPTATKQEKSRLLQDVILNLVGLVGLMLSADCRFPLPWVVASLGLPLVANLIMGVMYPIRQIKDHLEETKKIGEHQPLLAKEGVSTSYSPLAGAGLVDPVGSTNYGTTILPSTSSNIVTSASMNTAVSGTATSAATIATSSGLASTSITLFNSPNQLGQQPMLNSSTIVSIAAPLNLN